MKNDDQMYQSVLSRRNAYQLKKQQRIRMIRHAVPIAACFCFTVVLGLGIWQHRANLPHVPTVPEVTTASTETTTVTTTETEITAVPVTSKPAQTTLSTSAAVQTETVPETAAATTMQTTVVITETQPTSAVQTKTTTMPSRTSVAQTSAYIPEIAPPVTARIIPRTTAVPVMTTVETQPTTAVSVTETVPVTTQSETAVVQPEPIDVHLQPLAFADVTAAAEAIRQGDVSMYEDYEQAPYSTMFGRFQQDGFVYAVTDTDAVSRIESRDISLYPYARFEDIGIGYAVKFQEKNWFVTFYSADTAFAHDSISGYLEARMKRRTDKEITVGELTVSETFAANGQIVASAFVDDSHYLTVRTNTTEEELTEFLEALSYEQKPIDQEQG
jgi:hypothetical protein